MKGIEASMAGIVMGVLVKTGDLVSSGQDVVLLESMKMEVPITSWMEGKVVEIKVNVGDFVNEGDVVVILG